MKSKEYVAVEKNRSDSENGLYLKSVQEAISSYEKFRIFKRNGDYREILEHVNEIQGAEFLIKIIEQAPEFLGYIDELKENDLVGDPIKFGYPDIGLISPTTLRYIKVASDLKIHFGDLNGFNIVEIGVGYGGQALINDKLFKIGKYELMDLPPVLELTMKYLESHILNCGYKLSTLNQKDGNEEYDLVISNYAFSELPSNLQIKYIQKIISKAKRGYLTMNSGLASTERTKGKLTIEELKEKLPKFTVLNEIPLTAADNYIIIWGN